MKVKLFENVNGITWWKLVVVVVLTFRLSTLPLSFAFDTWTYYHPG